MVERRFWTRVRRPLEAQWIAPAALKAAARVSDLSFGGCYLSTRVTPHVGSHCQLFLVLPREGLTAMNAEVVHVHPHIGCGVRFVRPSPQAGEALARTVSAFLAER